MDTPRFGLPLLATGQAQKEVTHNEAIAAVDRLLHPAVVSRQQLEPPPSATAGQSWIVPAGATGAWAQRDDCLATHDGFGWQFDVPRAGMFAFVADEAGFVAYDEGWTADWPVSGLRIAGRPVLSATPETIAAPAGGAVIDAECRNAVNALIAVLRAQGVIG